MQGRNKLPTLHYSLIIFNYVLSFAITAVTHIIIQLWANFVTPSSGICNIAVEQWIMTSASVLSLICEGYVHKRGTE